jgi:parvulin-like peptidyl-prolyl isomerase
MRALRIVVAAVLLTGLVFASAGCSEKDVAARVNGEVIKKTDLDVQIAKLQEQYPDMFTGADGEGRLLDFQQKLLDNMINAALIRQAAAEQGINVSDADVQAQIDELKAGFADDAQFQEALAQAGMDESTLMQQVRETLVTEELIAKLTSDTPVTEEEIAEYYKGNVAQFEEQAAVHASHILFEPDDKATAEGVLAEIEGGADFAALAKEHSKDPGSAANGGDLGWPTTPYVPEFQAACDALDEGEVSELVETTFGWHIIKVIEKREARQKPIDEVSEQIEQLITQQRNADAYTTYLDDLRAEAEIEILIPELQVPVEQDAATPDE